MIIYPLPPQELDDATLSKQIKAIAETVCNVHDIKADLDSEKIGYEIYRSIVDVIPLPKIGSWEKPNVESWAFECRANYLNLVNMGVEACKEWQERFSCAFELSRGMSTRQLACHKMDDVIRWARGNVPNAGIKYEEIGHGYREISTPFPLVMHYKYFQYGDELGSTKFNVINSYRNYYRAKINKRNNRQVNQQV